MKIVTIYTLYGRRAGAELCFEKTIDSIHVVDSSIEWVIICNKQAYEILSDIAPYANLIYINNLNNQYKKAFWLEFMSKKVVNQINADCFWIPSGCNHFPGKWNIPTLTTFHDLGEYHIKHKYSLARMIFRKKICIPLAVHRSVAFTTVSEFTAIDMERYLKINKKERIKVIYNGHSPHKIKNPGNSELIISKWGLSKGKYFFTPGRTDYIGKGLDILLAAYKQILENGIDIELVLVGPQGEGHNMLLKKIDNKDCLKKRVKYLGRVEEEELVSLYSNCLATIISSRFEGFGFPILEAMEYGTPIICSDAGALPEIAGNTAFIFKTDDVDELSKLMGAVVNYDVRKMNSLSLKGKEHLKLFTWEKCATKMIEEFNKIVRLNR